MEFSKINTDFVDFEGQKYTENYTVLAHDVDARYCLKPSAYFKYMQETANHQMRDCRPTYEELLNLGQAFILSRMKVKVYSSPSQYENISVETWAGEDKGMLFKRCYRMISGDRILAEGISEWALLDIRNRTFIKYDAETFKNYPRGKTISGLSPRFKMPKDGFEYAGSRTVLYNDTDMNGHMNNTVYPDILTGYCPRISFSSPADMTIYYASEAKCGDVMDIFVSSVIEDGKNITYVRSMIGDRVNVEAKFQF